jgi:hypothetical protein
MDEGFDAGEQREGRHGLKQRDRFCSSVVFPIQDLKNQPQQAGRMASET